MLLFVVFLTMLNELLCLLGCCVCNSNALGHKWLLEIRLQSKHNNI